MGDLIEVGGQNRARAAIGQQRPGVLQNQREKDRRRRERERRRGHKSAYRPQSTTSNYQRDSINMELLDRIDLLIGERQASRARKRAREQDRKQKTIGVGSSGIDKEAQKKYIGGGSIKDLMKK